LLGPSGIRAKTLRYSIEMLEPVLPRKQVKDWHHEATQLQCGIGRERDLVRAVSLAQEPNVPAQEVQRLGSMMALQ
jgi:hypothetical protein